MNFVWNPAWYRTGESLWSLANKLAFVNHTSAASVLQLLTGLAPRFLRSTLLAPSAAVAVAVCEALQLSAAVSKYLFAGLRPLNISLRQYLSFGVRWCPECLAQSFHAALFQDWRISKCPWHGCPLLELCPTCGRAVDPLSLSAWTCNFCSTPLHRAPRNWISAFKMKLDAEYVAVSGQDCFDLQEVAESPLLTHYYWKGGGGGDPEGMPLNQSGILVKEWAYEEVAALTDSLLADHWGCFPNELTASMPQYSPVAFGCPVAGSLVCVAAWFDCMAEAVNGRWVGGDRPSGGKANASLDWAMWSTPQWACRVVVRENVRAWFAEALPVFTGAAADNHSSADWRPRTDSGAKWKVHDGQIDLTSHKNWPEVAHLVDATSHRTCTASCCV